jgi:hypothetical protein
MILGSASFVSAAPVILLGIFLLAFVVYCWVDLARTEQVRYLPKWLWAMVCLVSIPLGGILYLVFGKAR